MMEMLNENKCVQCDIISETKGDLKTHMHQQHDVTKSHTCNQCGYQANSASKLKSHMLVHSGEKPFICKQCNYSFTQAGKPQEAHANPCRSEGIQLQTVQLLQHTSW